MTIVCPTIYLCDTMWALVVWVWVSASQKIPLSVLARNPDKRLARDISHETGRGRGKEGPRAEQRRKQNREVDRTDQSTEVEGS